VKALILAGGFGKRLWPITLNRSKALLEVGGRPIIDYIVEKFVKLDLEEIIVSTNMKFEADFRKWSVQGKYKNIRLVIETSKNEKEKPGAVKALEKIVSEIKGDCFIVAADNLFTDSLEGMVKAYHVKKAPIIALYDIGDIRLVKHFGVVSINSESRITSFTEKPEKPISTLISTCIYLFPNRILQRITEYVDGGYDADAPGKFIEWLYRQEPTFGNILYGKWWDIGNIETYNDANRYFSEKIIGGSSGK
jgi:glucose-1-phosphate thymidylyltransferase